MRQHRIVPTLALLGISGAAHASIIGFTGPVELISPPIFVTPGADYATIPDDATVWNEKQNILLSNVAADMVNNPGSTASAVPGFVNATVDSHFFHFRHNSGAPIQGTLTFSGAILGVVFDWNNLNASDGLVAPGGTTYDPFLPRGIDLASELLSISGNVLTFDVHGDTQTMDTAQFRVFTEAVPTPGAAGLLAVGGLFAGLRRRTT